MTPEEADKAYDEAPSVPMVKVVGPPAASGWYWIEDDELIDGDPWCLTWVNLLGDEYSDGQPLMVAHDMRRTAGRTAVGRAASWEFFWDGEDWICPDDPLVATVPLQFVPVLHHQDMHEISRLEGERDDWRAKHAVAEAECVLLRAKVKELVDPGVHDVADIYAEEVR